MVVGTAVLVSPAGAARCGWPGYSYAGLVSTVPVARVAATVEPLRAAYVRSGHVAAWVGVGGYGAGPGGTDAWLQTGIVSRGHSAHVAYVEWKRPRAERRYLELAGLAVTGEPRTLAVRELPGRPGWWRAVVDSRFAGPAVRLRGSHGRLGGVVTAETWDGGRAVCNRFAYRFSGVQVGTAAPLELEDRGVIVQRSRPATFVARSRVASR